jgi:hypothetical protein
VGTGRRPPPGGEPAQSTFGSTPDANSGAGRCRSAPSGARCPYAHAPVGPLARFPPRWCGVSRHGRPAYLDEGKVAWLPPVRHGVGAAISVWSIKLALAKWHIATEVSVAIPERAVAEAGHAMKASVVCAGLLLLLFAGEAVGAGSGNSGDDIMPGCRGLVADSSGNLGDFRQGICAGSINAIIRFDPDICLPKGSTVGQAVRVVVQYIDSQPARLHEDFIDLAAEALRAAWPCPAQR